MKIEWDKDYKRIKESTVYQEELEAIYTLIKEERKNVCFSYESEQLCTNAYARLFRIVTGNNIPVKFMRRKNELYVFKKGE